MGEQLQTLTIDMEMKKKLMAERIRRITTIEEKLDQVLNRQVSNRESTHLPLGFILTLVASAAGSFVLSLIELTFDKLIKTLNFSAVLNMQMYTSFIATLVVTNVGLVGLIFTVSSLFSNFISTLGIPIVPLFAMILFGDRMDGMKVISLLLALWGFVSYFYQYYIDDKTEKKEMMVEEEIEADYA